MNSDTPAAPAAPVAPAADETAPPLMSFESLAASGVNFEPEAHGCQRHRIINAFIKSPHYQKYLANWGYSEKSIAARLDGQRSQFIRQGNNPAFMVPFRYMVTQTEHNVVLVADASHHAAIQIGFAITDNNEVHRSLTDRLKMAMKDNPEFFEFLRKPVSAAQLVTDLADFAQDVITVTDVGYSPHIFFQRPYSTWCWGMRENNIRIWNHRSVFYGSDKLVKHPTGPEFDVKHIAATPSIWTYDWPFRDAVVAKPVEEAKPLPAKKKVMATPPEPAATIDVTETTVEAHDIVF